MISRVNVHTILASALATKGSSSHGALDSRSCAAMHTGGGESINPKLWPCEDSLTVAEFDSGERLACVADAHWGGSSSEGFTRDLAEVWERVSGPTVPTRLYRALLQLESAYGLARPEEDRSETTVIVAHLEGTKLTWLNVGDSWLVLVPQAGGARILNEMTSFFVGNAPMATAPPGLAWTQGQAEVAPGDRLLLASDGIEEVACGMSLGDIEALLRGPDSLPENLNALLARGSDPARGGGRDNLALVALEV
jgi:serine/threonine protein phosphatase PrpC